MLLFSLAYKLPGTGDVMAFLTLFMRRQLPRTVSHFARIVKLVQRPGAGAPSRRLHGSSRLRQGEKGPWGKSRGPEHQQQYQLTDLDKADALVMFTLLLFYGLFRNDTCSNQGTF